MIVKADQVQKGDVMVFNSGIVYETDNLDHVTLIVTYTKKARSTTYHATLFHCTDNVEVMR